MVSEDKTPTFTNLRIETELAILRMAAEIGSAPTVDVPHILSRLALVYRLRSDKRISPLVADACTTLMLHRLLDVMPAPTEQEIYDAWGVITAMSP